LFHSLNFTASWDAIGRLPGAKPLVIG